MFNCRLATSTPILGPQDVTPSQPVSFLEMYIDVFGSAKSNCWWHRLMASHTGFVFGVVSWRISHKLHSSAAFLTQNEKMKVAFVELNQSVLQKTKSVLHTQTNRRYAVKISDHCCPQSHFMVCG